MQASQRGAQFLPDMHLTTLLQTTAINSNMGLPMQALAGDVELAEGCVWYETMIVLRPDMDEEERCALGRR